MKNSKGFTTIEMILTLTLVIVIMATITSVTFVYRDKSNYEEIVTETNRYKDTITKIIYDDILDTTNPVISINDVSNIINPNEYELVRQDNTKILLKIIDQSESESENDRKVSILYNDIEYIIPNSDTGGIQLQNTQLLVNEDYNIYTLKITFDSLLTESFTIYFMVS